MAVGSGVVQRSGASGRVREGAERRGPGGGWGEIGRWPKMGYFTERGVERVFLKICNCNVIVIGFKNNCSIHPLDLNHRKTTTSMASEQLCIRNIIRRLKPVPISNRRVFLHFLACKFIEIVSEIGPPGYLC